VIYTLIIVINDYDLLWNLLLTIAYHFDINC